MKNLELKIYKDDFGNTATIEQREILPYRNSPIKEKAFILSITADYENNFMYHRKVFPSEYDALNDLSEISCNTWKQIQLQPWNEDFK